MAVRELLLYVEEFHNRFSMTLVVLVLRVYLTHLPPSALVHGRFLRAACLFVLVRVLVLVVHLARHLRCVRDLKVSLCQPGLSHVSGSSSNLVAGTWSIATYLRGIFLKALLASALPGR